MAGTIPLSLTQQFDEFGKPLSGALLYIIAAGTVSTPQQPYQDAALTITQPNPIPLDAAGRVPQFFLADGYIKVRLDDKFGVTQLARDGILVIGPSAGGGGGGGVDPTTLIQTGAIQPFYGTGVLAGFVRMNGRTIGSATSGGTERANSDCQALFNFLWNADTNLTVAPSRGASSAADYAANKTITTPDFRGYAISGLDDMGNTAANRFGAFFSNPTVLGSAGGVPSVALGTANLPPYTPSGTNSAVGVSVTSTGNSLCAYGGSNPGITGSAAVGSGQVTTINSSGTVPAQPFTGNPQGGTSVAFSNIGPRKLCTLYIKL